MKKIYQSRLNLTPGNLQIGGFGDDILTGSVNDDLLLGNSGNDTLNGGAGSDLVAGGVGNDTFIYDAAANAGSFDRYIGGSGTDTLQLNLTADIWADAAFQDELATFLSLGVPTPFTFETLGLKVSRIETLTVFVDGTEIDLFAEFRTHADEAAMTDDDVTVTGNVLENDVVPHGVASIAIAVEADYGSVTIATDGTFVYTLDQDDPTVQGLTTGETLTDQFVYEVTDLDGDTDVAVVTITVQGTNSAPVVEDYVVEIEAGMNLTIPFEVSDPDGDDVHIVGVDDTGTVGEVQIRYDIYEDEDYIRYVSGANFDYLDEGETYTDTFTVTYADDLGNETTATGYVTVLGYNDAPVSDYIYLDVEAGTELQLEDPGAYDPEGSDVTFVGLDLTNNIGGFVYDEVSGTYTYTTAGYFDELDEGETALDVIYFKYEDEDGNVGQGGYIITVEGVNDGPIVDDVEFEKNEGTALWIDFAPTDPEGGDVTLVDIDSSDTVGEVTFDAEYGQFIYNIGVSANDPFAYLTDGETATDSFSVTYEDEDGNQTTATATITINGINDAPVVDNLSVELVAGENWWFGFDPVDPEGGEVTLVGFDTTNTVGTVELEETSGSFIYFTDYYGVGGDPFKFLADGETATDSFTVTYEDEDGNQTTAVASVLINGINDAPEVETVNVDIMSDESTVIALPEATDPEGGEVTVVSYDTTYAVGDVQYNANDGTFTYTADGNFDDLDDGDVVYDYISVDFSDPEGNITTGWITIAVTGESTAPIVSNPEFDVVAGEDATVAFTVYDPNGDEVYFQSLDLGETKGQVKYDEATDSFTYITNDAFIELAEGETENDVFQVTYIDDEGKTGSGTAVVTVIGVNDAPIVTDFESTVYSSSIYSSLSILDAYDPEGGELKVVGFDFSTSNANVYLNEGGESIYWSTAGNFDYLEEGESVVDTFSVDFADPEGNITTGYYNITVLGFNNWPDFGELDLTVEKGETITFEVPVTDPEGYDVTLEDIDTSATLGLLEYDAQTGEYSYNSNGAFDDLGYGDTATDTFTVTYSDPQGGSDSETYEITVSGGELVQTIQLGVTLTTPPLNVYYLGESVSGIGDVNGDGIDDFLIGAPDSYGNNLYGAGLAFVIFGNAEAEGGFDPTLDVSTLDGTNGFALEGFEQYARAGVSVSSAGDINGDGINDFVVGAAYADPDGIGEAGAVYVVFGKDTGEDGAFAASVQLSDLDGTNGFVLNGVSYEDYTGAEVEAAGDINNDGFDDIIIGAYNAEVDGLDGVGKAYVFLGHDQTDEAFLARYELDELNGKYGFVIEGRSEDENLGWAVSGIGDVNDDGIDDFAVTAYRREVDDNDRSGEAYVIFGVDSTDDGDFGTSFDLSSLDGKNGFAMAGVDNYDFLGTAVSSAGDINNDGIDDFVATARYAGFEYAGATEEGRAYVVFGTDNGFDATLDLASLDGTDGFQIYGDTANEYLGISASSAGDVDGDGIDDILIGKPYEKPYYGAESSTGAAFLILGQDTATDGDFDAVVDLFYHDSSIGYKFNGFLLGSSTGYDVSGAGDVNADGYADILIGANDFEGESYLVYGGAERLAFYDALDLYEDGEIDLTWMRHTPEIFETDITAGSVGFLVLGNESFGSLGASGASAGDFNGDGIDDFVVGASDGDRAYVIFGQDTASDGYTPATLSVEDLDGTNGVLLSGDNNTGYSVASAGDVNGDGINDLIIGTNYSDGKAYVVVGKDTATEGDFAAELSMEVFDGSDGFIIEGLEYYDRLGHAVSAAGDVNGDGIDDIMVSAWGASSDDLSNAGAVYFIYGTDDGFDASLDVTALDGTDGFVVYGPEASSHLGYSLDLLGDVNGDGITDYILGAYDSDYYADDEGEAFVIFGEATGFPADIDLTALDGTNGFAIIGPEADSWVGDFVAAAGDVNGDGINDIMISAAGVDTADATDAGAVYVVLGQDTVNVSDFDDEIYLSDLEGSEGFSLTGTQEYGYVGEAITSVGDVNGDGVDDMLIGAAWDEANGLSGAGRAFLFFGVDTEEDDDFLETYSLDDLDGTDGYIFTGVFQDEGFGYSVASAGDVNGDGIADMLIGAVNNTTGLSSGSEIGATYVVYGGDDNLELMDAADGTQDGVIDMALYYALAAQDELVPIS